MRYGLFACFLFVAACTHVPCPGYKQDNTIPSGCRDVETGQLADAEKCNC